MLEKAIKLTILIAIMVAIPLLWWQFLQGDLDIKSKIMATGTSLFLFGLCYKLMGSWDLIPDWIPLLGSLDDKVAWIMILIGIATGAGGFFLFQ